MRIGASDSQLRIMACFSTLSSVAFDISHLLAGGVQPAGIAERALYDKIVTSSFLGASDEGKFE